MRLSQNGSMLSEGPDRLLPPRHHSAHRENCRMKWTIYKVKSDNSYDNHRESTNALQRRHCLPPHCQLSCSRPKSQAVSAERANISRWRSFAGRRTYRAGASSAHKGGRNLFFLHKSRAVNARWASISRWRSFTEQGPQKGPLFEDCLSTARYARPLRRERTAFAYPVF